MTNTTDAPSSPPPPTSAAATVSAGLHRSSGRASPGLRPSLAAANEFQGPGSAGNSPRLNRRSLGLNTLDPHHRRNPSLGELHQELESEQEGQVNRLLHMIRLQQDQLNATQRHDPHSASPVSADQTAFSTSPAAAQHTPVSTTATEQSSPHSPSIPFPQAQHGYFHRPSSLSRQSSARLSTAGTSPAMRPHSGSLGPLSEDFLLGGTRDECAFYQAETQTLTRENQMLKLRIRELERQVADHETAPSATLPPQNSFVANTSATFTSESAPAILAEAAPKG